MKVRLRETPTIDEYGDTIKDMEYLVLGIEPHLYYILDENNMVSTLRQNLFVITDHSHPEFWIEDCGRWIPEEWSWDKFYSLHDEPFQETDEIWSITQFAKGLEKFNLPIIPKNFEVAYDKKHKSTLINTCLKMAAIYDSIPQHGISWLYDFGSFNALSKLPYFSILNGEPQYYERILLTNENESGFEQLAKILKQIGSPFEYEDYNADTDQIEEIRNRILFSIWSLWGTTDFDILQLKYVRGLSGHYILKKDDDMYLLSFDYIT